MQEIPLVSKRCPCKFMIQEEYPEINGLYFPFTPKGLFTMTHANSCKHPVKDFGINSYSFLKAAL